jgi:hypothetical protein
MWACYRFATNDWIKPMKRSSKVKKINATRSKATKRSDSKTKKRLVVGALVTAIVGGTISSPLASLITNGVGISEPNLVYIGGPPKTPSLQIRSHTASRGFLHVTLRPVFKNWSFKGGHVEKVKITRDGLNDAPEIIEVISYDKSEIGWFQEKEIRCELLITVNPSIVGPQLSTLRFRIYFYGPKGNQIYGEEIAVEGWQKAA